MMALDGKTIIKEEITDKDAYEAAASTNNLNRRTKGVTNSSCSSSKETGSNLANGSNNISLNSTTLTNSSRTCRTPDSPESARVVAPRSPISPQLLQHHSSLILPLRPQRNASTSPVVNGATTTPPPPPPQTATQKSQVTVAAAAAAAVAAAAHVEQARLLGKIRKFLGSLVQLSQEIHPEVSERIRGLVLSLASGGLGIEEFRLALQESINLPLRSYVIPLLKNHISLLQREIIALARATNQSTLQYVTSNENAVMEFTAHGPPAEYSDIFIHVDNQNVANGLATNLVFKRRASDTLMEAHGHNGNAVGDWNDYVNNYAVPPKRLHGHPTHLNAGGPAFAGTNQPTIFDYSSSGPTAAQTDAGNSFSGLMDKNNHRDERDLRSAMANEGPLHRPINRGVMPVNSGAGNTVSSAAIGGEEEWKNIHTMLNCISAMVDKTKRAITILQQRGVEPQQNNYGEFTQATLLEIRRQTEEKVAEFKRNAEEAVNQVKRQAVVEIQRAVVAAETRAAEVMAQERLRMEKFFVEMSRHTGNERDLDNKSPSIANGQNACWNCGRKANETCSGCNLARYCGAFCQHKDWEHHHQICGITRSNELSNSKQTANQLIPLAANLRGAIVRSSPTPSQQPTTHAPAHVATNAQQTSSSTSSSSSSSLSSSSTSANVAAAAAAVAAAAAAASAAPPTSLLTNGIGNK